jgi:FkbH-like protein
VRELKLVIWDLDETLLNGVFAEGDRDVAPGAEALLVDLHDRGVLQALATQNEPDVVNDALSHFDWLDYFQVARCDFAPKRHKLVAILDELEVSPQHTVFIDGDPFERDVMKVQVPGLAAWSVPELRAHVDSLLGPVTAEARRRPEMYRAMKQQKTDEQIAGDLETFLAACDIQVTIRPFEEADAPRAIELLTRTNRMNLGTLDAPEEVVRIAGDGDSARLVVAELGDRYGDSGRVGFVRLTPSGDGEAIVDSIAISCRARARGLSLALLVGMLRHPQARFERYLCLFRSTGRNRPLRMLLWGAGFSSVPGTEELRVDRNTLDAVVLPSWVRVEYASDARGVALGT